MTPTDAANAALRGARFRHLDRDTRDELEQLAAE